MVSQSLTQLQGVALGAVRVFFGALILPGLPGGVQSPPHRGRTAALLAQARSTRCAIFPSTSRFAHQLSAETVLPLAERGCVEPSGVRLPACGLIVGTYIHHWEAATGTAGC